MSLPALIAMCLQENLKIQLYFKGAVWPAISSLYVNWAPPVEKSRLIGFSSSGVNIGNIFALSLGGWLCDEGFDGGWGSVFYIFGLIGIVWAFLMMLLNSDSPSNHKFISITERDYIIESIGEVITKKNIDVCTYYINGKGTFWPDSKVVTFLLTLFSKKICVTNFLTFC